MRTLTTILGTALSLALASPAAATATQCTTRIDGETVTIFYSSDDPTYSSMRERLFRRGSECPGAVVITYLMPELTADQRTVFCANYDPQTRSHSQPAQGRRDSFGRCVEPSRTCALVNTTRQEAAQLMGLGAQADRREGLLPSTISAVTHTSGAMILSGNAGAITGLLSSVMAAPAVMAGAAASVVVIGGAIYLCSDD